VNLPQEISHPISHEQIYAVPVTVDAPVISDAADVPKMYSSSPETAHSMRMVWEQHVYWTRLLLISILERLKDQSATTGRPLKNLDDIAGIFAVYYPPAIANKVSRLLTEHLKIGAALITALRDGKTAEAKELDSRWYINADEIAAAFAGISPHYNREELHKMLYTHLDLTKQEAAMRIEGNYHGQSPRAYALELCTCSSSDEIFN
jgi:hypothetical protein